MKYDLPTAVPAPPTLVPQAVKLYDNYPNPFNPRTSIRFFVPEASQASVRVYDALGRTVATLVDGCLQAGEHSVLFDANNLPSGVYLYVLNFGNQRLARKMVLLK